MNVDSELQARLRKELTDEREGAIAELRRHGADPFSEEVAAIDVDDNFADTAAATTERGEVLALIDGQRERLAAADVALARLDAGTYGTCEVCDQPIPEARLEARPLSVRCVACATAV